MAADEIINVIIESLRSDNGVHSETAISSAARLAGTFLFRSFEFPYIDAQPGSPVLSEEANEHGPLLLQTLGAALNVLNVGLDGGRLSPNIPEDHEPHLSVTDAQQLMETPLRAVTEKHKLTDQQAAHACAIAAARLIQMCTAVLDPHVGFALASFGFVEGAKTMPIPLGQSAYRA